MGLGVEKTFLLVLDPYALSAPLGQSLPLVDRLSLLHKGLYKVYKKRVNTHLEPKHMAHQPDPIAKLTCLRQMLSSDQRALSSERFGPVHKPPRLRLSLL